MKQYKVNFNGFNSKIFSNNKLIKKIVLFNKTIFCIFLMDIEKKTDFFFDGTANNAIVNRKSYLKDKLEIKKINYFLSDLFSSFFIKIKFKGKGYRLQSFKKKKIINFTFGHSHIYYMFLKKNFFKRLNKNKYIFLEKNREIFNDLKRKIKKIKPINKYTLRGLRISKLKIVKRKGRKSPTLLS